MEEANDTSGKYGLKLVVSVLSEETWDLIVISLKKYTFY